MSWGIEWCAFLRNVRSTDIDDRIADCKEMLRFYEARILTLSSVNTQLFTTDHEDIPRYEFLAQEIPNLVSGIVEEAGNLALLESAKIAEEVEDV